MPAAQRSARARSQAQKAAAQNSDSVYGTVVKTAGGANSQATAAQGPPSRSSAPAATAEQTYAETSSSLERVNTLVAMTQGSGDIKESIDLNTRMLAELSVQLAKSLELQSIEAVYNGQAGVLSAATIAEERAYMTFSNE